MSEKEGKDRPGKEPSTPSRIPLPSSRRGLSGFIHETLAEMKRVHWPTRGESNRLTGVVLTVCGGAVLLLYGLSLAFEQMLHLLITGGAK